MARYIDAVSKAEVLKTYADLYDVFDDYKEIIKELHKVYDKLNDLPTADVVEVRHGEWLDHQNGRWIYAKCSICGTIHDTKTNYCPNCGADLRERRE